MRDKKEETLSNAFIDGVITLALLIFFFRNSFSLPMRVKIVVNVVTNEFVKT
jgi:hypothetical protein